jgi:DNA-directed RNA polymerase specialized sigma24 family protein
VTTERRHDRRRGGRATARPNKALADSSAGLLATVYQSNTPDDPTPSEQIDAIRQLRERLDEEEQLIVFGLRLRQTSWQTIGDMFGITRQAAQQRFTPA